MESHLRRQELIDRRRYTRYEVRTRIWLEEYFDAPLKKLNTVNVSTSGILFESDVDYPIGKRMKVLIEMPYFLDLLEVETSVRHTEVGANCFVVGVNFEHIEGLDNTKFQQFLKAYAEEHSTSEDKG